MNVAFDTQIRAFPTLGSGRLFRQTCRMGDFVVGPEAADEDTGPVTIYDIQAAEERKVRVRALPRLTRQALRIAWAAGRSEFVVSTLLQIVGAAALCCSCSSDNRVCKHSSMHSKPVSHSLQWPPGRLRLPALPESSHSSTQCSANVKKSSAK